MAVKDYRKHVAALAKAPENQECIDCRAKHPKWASLYYGTFLCLDCAGAHRSLGVYLESVRSVGLDTWDKKAFLPLSLGGNRPFLEHLQSLGLSRPLPDAAYKDPRVIAYSERLAKQVSEKTGEPTKCARIQRSSTDRSGASKPLKTRTVAATSSTSSLSHVPSVAASLSDIGSNLSRRASTLTAKTVVYGTRLGSSLASGAKRIINASSEFVSNIYKPKDGSADNTSVEDPRQGPKWS